MAAVDPPVVQQSLDRANDPVDPPPVPPAQENAVRREERKANAFVGAWKKIGGGSLVLSVLIHVALVAVAGLIVRQVVTSDPAVDFLPGGGSKAGQEASSELAHRVQMKRQHLLKKSMPMQKVASSNPLASISLPDLPAESLEIPDMSNLLGGSLGSFGTLGAGRGSGVMNGVTFKPVFMFGRELKDSRRIAVVMDVSRSMTRYLPAVAKELDKIARQSVLVLYFGCGLRTPKGKFDDKVQAARGESFASFWQHWQGKTPLNLPMSQRKELKFDASQPIPLQEIYARMNGRPSTFYIDFIGVSYAQSALLCREVMGADTIYWFADFQDAVDEETMDVVRRGLQNRRQKLVIHASARGRSFEKVCANLVTPLGGEVIEAKVAK